MRLISTRGKDSQSSLLDAMKTGLATDGGLYVPDNFPIIKWRELPKNISYKDFAVLFLRNFYSDNPLKDQLEVICDESFDFPLKLKELDQFNNILELFHGPTLSFKDFGARFLAANLTRTSTDKPFTILVATSGDTGSAVASAFYQKPNVRVLVLFPKDKISLRQQQQITCWGDNIQAVSVDGTFDDCQHLVKKAFSMDWWSKRTHLNTANSINIGRLLPQSTYYAFSSWQQFLKTGAATNFIVPSGNMGNVCACFWAKKMGFPIDKIILSQNENDFIGRYLKNHNTKDRTIPTLANAMDVSKPSNFERLYTLFSSDIDFDSKIQAFKASDNNIRQAIADVYKKWGEVICPHTATAFSARAQLDPKENFCMVATAHPAKFEQIVEPIVGHKLDIPGRLQTLINKSHSCVTIAPDMDGLCSGVWQLYK